MPMYAFSSVRKKGILRENEITRESKRCRQTWSVHVALEIIAQRRIDVGRGDASPIMTASLRESYDNKE